MQSLIRPIMPKGRPLFYFHYWVGMQTPVGKILKIHLKNRYITNILTDEDWFGNSGELYEILQNSRVRKDAKDN